ncbi:MAG: hypothetical protein R3250_07865 [Melioribacteraceae bacterium]|nr:hypothetical protein [Melioribacteraceae bacterium]
MKQLIKIFALALFLFVTSDAVWGQEAETPMLVVSFQKVKMADMSKAEKLFEDNFAPILNAMVDEGYLLSWGRFVHAWGDEWNLNNWYTAKDMESFSAFWTEYTKRIGAENEAWEKLRGMIQEHKDNIYVITSQYPMPPAE